MGDARRRKLSGRKPAPKGVVRPRSPEEVEVQIKNDDHFYGIMAASIDFIHSAQEDAFRQHTRKVLNLDCSSEPR